MNTPYRIKVIVGSTREGRFGPKPAKWIANLASELENVEVEILDLKDYVLPYFEEPTSPSYTEGNYNPTVERWAKKVAEADAFIILAAEYNHGYTAVLKNSLDYVYREWNKKPVAFVGYGAVGGARAVEQLRQVVVELEMAPIRHAVHMTFDVIIASASDPKEIPDALGAYEPQAKKMLDELLWWTKTLKRGREEK